MYIFTTNDIEDEYHFVLICPRYHNLRMHLIRRFNNRNTNLLKLIQLLNSTEKKQTGRIIAVYIS